MRTKNIAGKGPCIVLWFPRRTVNIIVFISVLHSILAKCLDNECIARSPIELSQEQVQIYASAPKRIIQIMLV